MGIPIHRRNTGNTRRRSKLMNEINVTPMVDVMLVLLIIFMITSPMLVGGVNVNLPKTNANAISGNFSPLVITINEKDELFLLETKIHLNSLANKLKEATKENKETPIFVKADKNLPYGKVLYIMSNIQNAGFSKVSLVSDIKHK
jgi:biopolymer transport protein TolR